MKKIIKASKFIIREKRPPNYREILVGLNIKKQTMPLPIFIQLDPTTRCNLNCVMCIRSKMNSSRLNQDLSLEKFKHILKEIPTLKYIRLQGIGEPILNKDIWKITQYGIQKGIEFTTSTNGTLINKDNVDLFLKNFKAVGISLDAASPEIYFHIRQANFYNKIVENIKLMVQRKKELKAKTEIYINFVISHLNYKEIDAITKLAKNCGVDSIGFVEVVNWKTSLENDYDEEKEFILQARQFKKIIDENVLRVKQEVEQEKSIKIKVCRFSDKFKLKCRWSFDYCHITVDGFVTPCSIRTDPDVFNFGNIFETSFKEIWNSKKYQQFRQTIIEDLPNSICDSCPD